MEYVIKKHCDARIESYWFKPHKTTLSDEEVMQVYRNRDRLRENATKHELVVAQFLDDNDVYFIPQLPVFCPSSRVTYWADFFIPRGKVVIEVDGRSHDRPYEMTKDAYRDAEFEKKGFTVIRIRNTEVDSGAYKDLLAEVTQKCKCRHHKKHLRKQRRKSPVQNTEVQQSAVTV